MSPKQVEKADTADTTDTGWYKCMIVKGLFVLERRFVSDTG